MSMVWLRGRKPRSSLQGRTYLWPTADREARDNTLILPSYWRARVQEEEFCSHTNFSGPQSHDKKNKSLRSSLKYVSAVDLVPMPSVGRSLLDGVPGRSRTRPRPCIGRKNKIPGVISKRSRTETRRFHRPCVFEGPLRIVGG